jgi:hypothetical protein
MKLELHQYRQTNTPELGRLYADGQEVCTVRMREGLLPHLLASVTYTVTLEDTGRLAVMPGVYLDMLVDVDLRTVLKVGEPCTLTVRLVGDE